MLAPKSAKKPAKKATEIEVKKAPPAKKAAPKKAAPAVKPETSMPAAIPEKKVIEPGCKLMFSDDLIKNSPSEAHTRKKRFKLLEISADERMYVLEHPTLDRVTVAASDYQLAE